MTSKIYKSAMGKTVDLGALILENENTRAVGNMNVNARGDVLDESNRVIDTKTRQVQRQYKKQATNTSDMPITTSTRAARQQHSAESNQNIVARPMAELASKENDVVLEETTEIIAQPEPVAEEVSTPIPRGGLAAALAKSQAVKQELMKTPRQLAQERAGVKKI